MKRKEFPTCSEDEVQNFEFRKFIKNLIRSNVIVSEDDEVMDKILDYEKTNELQSAMQFLIDHAIALDDKILDFLVAKQDGALYRAKFYISQTSDSETLPSPDTHQNSTHHPSIEYTRHPSSPL